MPILIDETTTSTEQAFTPPPESRLEVAAAAEAPANRAESVAQLLVLAIVLAAPAIICVHSAVANDPDIWWHIRTGQWMLEHRAVPRVDPFSGVNAGKPWPAYSWLFDLLTFQIFQRFSLVGIVGYSAGMLLAVAVALHHLIKRVQADFTIVTMLIFSACYAMGHLFTPRPWLFTILFFAIQLDILMHARRTGRVRELLWLPVIFALWSNIHIQFIDGLVVLGLALAESVATARGIGVKSLLRVPWAVAALVGSVLATFINPFGWHIYRVAYDLASQPGVMDKISELKAIPFRDLTDYSVLGLTLATTSVLAWQRRLRIFEVGLLSFAALVSFRSQRDVWVIAVAAAAILASILPARANLKSVRLPRFATAIAGVLAAVAVLASLRVLHVNNALLETQVEKTYPVKAVAAIQANHYPGPLFNDFNWGGYLIWALRVPVSIDGRAAFYGDQAIDRSIATWNAEPDWSSDPSLKQANLIIGPPKASLIQILRLDPHYQLVYEDKIAVVFRTRR